MEFKRPETFEDMLKFQKVLDENIHITRYSKNLLGKVAKKI